MLLRVFRGTGPGVVLLIFIMALAVWSSAFLAPHSPSSFIYDLNPMPLYQLLRSAAALSAFAGVVISFTLVLLMSVLLVSFNTGVFFINVRTFLPAIIYIMFSGFFPHYQLLNPVLPSAVLLMLAVMRIMEAYRKTGTAFNFFDSALIISTGSLFYANLIWFGLLVIIGIAILRTGNPKEIILALLGLCTPLLITAGFYYVAGKDLYLLLNTVNANLFGHSGEYYISRVAIAGLTITGLCSLISIFYLFSVVKSKKIKSRKTFTILIWILIISLALFFVLPSVSVEINFLAAVPLSYFLSHYFLFTKNRILAEILFSAIILVVIIHQVIYLL
jgi:hypothetical protein